MRITRLELRLSTGNETEGLATPLDKRKLRSGLSQLPTLKYLIILPGEKSYFPQDFLNDLVASVNQGNMK